MDEVILVDDKDNQIGTKEKLKAHEDADLHRAFSIFIFNNKGDVMLQRRAITKYHSGGLWTNTCCSHPRPNETTDKAAHRRLREEMGFDCPLTEVFSFIYKVPLDHGLTEHEFDHVFTGIFEDTPIINGDEVEEWKWISPADLIEDMETRPKAYTFWFNLVAKDVLEKAGYL